MEENKKNKIPNVPNLRFNFEGEYVESCIGDLIVQKGKRAKGQELKYKAYSINNQTGFSIQEDQWGEASYTKLEKNGYKVIEKNDIAYNPARINVGSVGLYKQQTPCIVSSLYVCFTTKPELSPDYLFKYLKSDKFNKKVLSTQEGGVRTYFFFDKLQKTKMFVPTISEQTKVNAFLDCINEKIDTQNKIIDKLESLRVQIKERIFDLGSLKKTISDVLTESNKKSNIQDQYPVLSSTVKGLFLQSDYFDREVASSDNIGYKIVKKGQIIISPQNLWMGNITYNDSFEHGIVSPSYKVFDIKEAYSKIYIYWLLTSKHSLFNYGLVSEQGASIVRRNLNYDSFLNITLPLCNEEQQKHISKLIKSIEAKLKVEKQRAELFAKQKNYLLSNLFI
ncbi:MAG: hypothetical protein E7175_00545 [Erysipelotrichaceae bacterium]|nr:hypothetical protein [Erysipelotrichaceae bacterium]